jgi:hypothetical protein
MLDIPCSLCCRAFQVHGDSGLTLGEYVHTFFPYTSERVLRRAPVIMFQEDDRLFFFLSHNDTCKFFLWHILVILRRLRLKTRNPSASTSQVDPSIIIRFGMWVHPRYGHSVTKRFLPNPQRTSGRRHQLSVGPKCLLFRHTGHKPFHDSFLPLLLRLRITFGWPFDVVAACQVCSLVDLSQVQQEPLIRTSNTHRAPFAIVWE